MKPEEYTKKYIISEIEKIRYTYRLNDVIRYGLERKEGYMKTQSVSEHVYNLLILAKYFYPLENELLSIGNKMNWSRVIDIILMHDLVEIETGDIVMAKKTESSTEKEGEVLHLVVEQSPDFISEKIPEVQNEYDNMLTYEARFVKAIDKLEAQFWFEAVCAPAMIMATTTLDDRVKNERKRRMFWEKLNFPIVEKFALVLHDIGVESGLYDVAGG